MAYGWRARIGYMTPAVMEILPYEWYKLAPEGVGLVGVTFNIRDWKRDEFDRAIGQVYDVAESLAGRKVQFLIHGGVPLVVSRGPGFDLELIRGITERTGLPATTSVHSGMAALRALGVERVGLVAPYPPEVMDNTAAFLEGNGFKVEARERKDVAFKELQWMEEREIYEFVRSAVVSSASIDGLYMPCPQWPVGAMVEAFEEDFGIPVVTSAAADLWKACTTLGVGGLQRRGGALMSVRPEPVAGATSGAAR